MHLRFSIVFLLLSSITFGQSLNIDKIYDFSPSKLTKAEQEKKIPPIDKLWQTIKSDTLKYLPLLRNELNAPNHNPFFYYDGSALLLLLSKADNDKAVAANAIAKCDLGDIDYKEYVTTLNKLSNDGINIVDAAMKILEDTSFAFFLPAHAMYFTQSDCLTYMLLPQKQELYVDALIAKFKTANPKAQKSIINTFWFAYTCKGDSLINAASLDRSLSKDVVAFAKETMKSPDFNNETNDYMKKLDKDLVVELRKQSLRRFSDESLDELTIATLWLRKNATCR